MATKTIPDTEFVLDETTQQLLADIDAQSKQAAQQAAMNAVRPYSEQMQGILTLTCRMNKLEGEWKLSPDGKRLTKQGQPEQPDYTKKSTRKR